MKTRRPVIGVMGSASEGHPELAIALGQWLAKAGFHLLTGGGEGVMSVVSKAFYEVEDREGLVIGVLPSGYPELHRPGYPNPWVEIVIQTHLPYSGIKGVSEQSRNHINVLSSDILVVLPGGTGTRSELALAVHYNKPVIVYEYAASLQTDWIPGLIETTVDLERVKSFINAWRSNRQQPSSGSA